MRLGGEKELLLFLAWHLAGVKRLESIQLLQANYFGNEKRIKKKKLFSLTYLKFSAVGSEHISSMC